MSLQYFCSIGLTYGNTLGTCHGSSADLTTYTLAEGEYITAVSGGPSNGMIEQVIVLMGKLQGKGIIAQVTVLSSSRRGGAL